MGPSGDGIQLTGWSSNGQTGYNLNVSQYRGPNPFQSLDFSALNGLNSGTWYTNQTSVGAGGNEIYGYGSISAIVPEATCGGLWDVL